MKRILMLIAGFAIASTATYAHNTSVKTNTEVYAKSPIKAHVKKEKASKIAAVKDTKSAVKTSVKDSSTLKVHHKTKKAKTNRIAKVEKTKASTTPKVSTK